ncbi:MAG: stage II sporulation protein P [Bacillota bacterium]
MVNRRRLLALLALLALGLTLGAGAAAPRAAGAAQVDWGGDEREAGYYTIVDEKGAILLTTGLKVSLGDRFIAVDDREYEVFAVDGDTAKARPASGQAGLAPMPVPAFSQLRSRLTEYLDRAFGAESAAAPGKKTIAIYHTHSDESYVPSDGAANIPAHGGIFQVGAAFREALKRKGLNVVESTQPHDPHDNLAYNRSRRTAMDLLARTRPAALFDVHRDTAPAQAYQKTVAGEKVTSVMFVIGRQNPNMQANLSFAKDLKAAADKNHPGLVRAIYFGQGRYNQDLSPRALLIEVGAESNTKTEAEKGVSLLADAVPKVIGTAGPSGVGLTQGSGATRAIITIVAGILLLGAAYLVIASGGFHQAWERLRRLPSTELAGYLKDREETGMSEKKKGRPVSRDASRDRLTSEHEGHGAGSEDNEVWMTTGDEEGKERAEEEEAPGSRTGGHEDRQTDDRTHHQEEP